MNQARVLQVFHARLARLPLAAHPALMFNPWLEGYRDYTFGGRAGPSVGTSNVFHELAHAAQFGAEKFRSRASEQGFYFKIPSRFIFDRYCVDARTSQATLRELETFAYQLHLMQAAGSLVKVKDFALYSGYVMRLMHDWYCIPGEGEEERKQWCASQILERYEKLSQAECLERLEQWLDRTRMRLNRQRLSKRAYQKVNTRYRPLLDVVTENQVKL